ncbi:hypothetical protein [Sporosarcina sp. HYO08]|uniref:hypothetical protein n=1 Tax=Sporosarcina sp. HYO08 TaxID=1759557 RepID=UPI000799D070|nr:hypothetical protein [Sporosarcina sp. HYO08]KXH81972.1 hypothetical protein AU377_06860 [Sporosarcina sp. HYO08]
MKKAIFRALSLAFVSLLLFGCQPKENISTEKTVNSSPEPENSNQLSINNNFIGISFSSLNGFNKVNFDDQQTLNAFQDIFSSVIKEDGIVNMTDPEFYMDVIYDNNEQLRFYLWIGEKGQRSTFMKTKDANTIYTVSPEQTDRLIMLVENTFN